MKKVIISATLAVVISAVVVTKFLDSNLKELHSGFSVSTTGSVMLCGVDSGYNYDGVSVLTGLERQYSFKAFTEELSAFRDSIEDSAYGGLVVPDYPEEIDGYFYNKNLKGNLLLSTEELKLKVYGYKDIYVDMYQPILDFREKSELTFKEAKEKHIAWYEAEHKARGEIQAITDKLLSEFLKPYVARFKTASCIFNSSEYSEIILKIIDGTLGEIESKLADANLQEIKSELIKTASKTLILSGVDFTEIELDREMSIAIVKNDGDTVGYLIVKYGLYQDVYKFYIMYVMLGDVGKIKPDYIYN